MADRNELLDNEHIVELPIETLERGFYQPRELFDPELMESTKLSIQQKGQKYPIIVRPIKVGNPLFNADWKDIHYEIADGERRTRCLKALGATQVKALIRDLNDWEMLDYGVTTNDSVPLNPIERAKVFRRLAKDFNKTQEEIAKSYNMKQQQISEYVRLLDLPPEIQDMTARAVISMRHARELLKLPDAASMLKVGKLIVEKNISTRKLTDMVRQLQDKPARAQVEAPKIDLDDIVLPREAMRSHGVDGQGNEAGDGPALELAPPQPPAARAAKPGWFGHLVDAMAQVNALLLPSPLRRALEKYLAANPSLASLRPEQYLALFELSLLLPTLALFGLYLAMPILALGASCALGAVLCMKLFEDNPPAL